MKFRKYENSIETKFYDNCILEIFYSKFAVRPNFTIKNLHIV